MKSPKTVGFLKDVLKRSLERAILTAFASAWLNLEDERENKITLELTGQQLSQR